ncbi:MAG: RNA polymerase sigma factor [Acidimicrobiales bacterium]
MMNQGASSDAELIAQSFDDPERFAALFERHWLALHRYCVARAGDEGEDIAAEVFRIAFDQRERYDLERPSALPWLYGVAANLLRRRARTSARRRRAIGRLRGWATEHHTPDLRIVEQTDAVRALGPALAAVDQLRPDDRELVFLVAWTDLTYQEIAEAFDIPIGTVRSRLSRARARLGAELEAFR